MSSTVAVSQGALRGKKCVSCNGTEFYSFEGIPYAKPPVGKLRFRDPQPPDNWSGVLDATKPGPKCFQMDPYSQKGFEGSEDCLYLNIYTPSLPGEKLEKLPVIFFVHGGRFIVGHGDYYRPDYIIDKDVILVTINYRLHVLGYLCLHTEEAPGNASFKDTIMALKWVKNNIKYFNGDDNNVTAMGESAGAGAVSSYLVSKMADGLVHKIIAQSGTLLSDLMMIEEDPIEKAKNLAKLLGHDFTDIKKLHKFLLSVPVEDLVANAMQEEISRPEYIINAHYLPVVEKKLKGVEPFFEEFPMVTILKNKHKVLPFLTGLSSQESALFTNKDADGNIIYITDIQRLIPRYLSLKHDSPKSKKIANALQKYYFKNDPIDDNKKEEYFNIRSDALFNRDVLIFCECYSKRAESLFLYNFRYFGNLNTRTMKTVGLRGATHGDIMQYLFYRKNKHEKREKKDEEMIKFLSEAWCSFARNGKPTWTNQRIQWLPYKQDTRLCLDIDQELSLIKYPYWERIKVWLDNMGERSKL